MSKEYLDRKEVNRAINKLKEEDKVDGGDKIHACNFEELVTAICQLQPKNQVVIAEGRFIISNGKEFGISHRACYIKLSPRKLIGIGALGRRLEEKGVEGKKVLIILETLEEE